MFETMRMLRLTYPEAQQLFRRMVFNVVSRNWDDHTKNFAFLLKPNTPWSLAPAYDICHAYRLGNDWVSQHALSINGKRKGITKNDLLDVAKQMNIKNANEIISDVVKACANWLYFAEEVNVDIELRNAIKETHLAL